MDQRGVKAAYLTNAEVAQKEDKGLNEDPLIAIRGLQHDYAGGIPALRGIDLDIYAGEFIALVGQNGAGKTTLAKHLNALLKPSSGQVTVAGRDTRHAETGELARHVGFLFQNPDHQIFAATVENELEYGLRNIGLDEEEIRTRVTKALEDTHLTQRRNTHPFSLGKGERQLIALASVLALKPEILVVDEPTTGLDWQGTLNMMELIRGLHKNGTSVIMVAHDMELVARYAERVVVMKEGRVFLDGSVSEVFAAGDRLREAGIEVPTLVRLAKMLNGEGKETAAQGEVSPERAVRELGEVSQEAAISKLTAVGLQRVTKQLGEVGSAKEAGSPGEISLRGEFDQYQTTPKQGILQRFDVRVRFLLLLVGAIISFLFTDPRYAGAVALAALGTALLSHLPLARLKILCVPWLPMFMMIAVLTGFTAPVTSFQHPENRMLVVSFWTNVPGGISLGGVLLSLTFFLRVFSLVLLSALFTWTTGLEELLDLLKAWRVPEIVSFVIVTALRFIPAIDQKRQRILEAQSARGAYFQGKGIVRQIRVYVPLMIPLLINGILMADTLAIAMLNRGFGYSRIGQESERKMLRLRDYAAICLLVFVAAAAFYVRVGLRQGTL